jgi:hypothetical protein
MATAQARAKITQPSGDFNEESTPNKIANSRTINPMTTAQAAA